MSLRRIETNFAKKSTHFFSFALKHTHTHTHTHTHGCQRNTGIFIHTERMNQNQDQKQSTQTEKGLHNLSRINHNKITSYKCNLIMNEDVKPRKFVKPTNLRIVL